MFTLYDHQEEALDALSECTSPNGRIVIPTGGGKTAIEALYLASRLSVPQSKSKRIHLVIAPRIVLVNQLFAEYRKYVTHSGRKPKFRAIAFHSGREPECDQFYFSEKSTTDVKEVREAIKGAHAENVDMVVFSSYASCGKLKSIPFHTMIADESQYCTQAENFDSIVSIKAVQKRFFTATERWNENGDNRANNNEDVFGKIEYQVSARELIDLKIIVPPRLHVMSATSKDKVKTVLSEVRGLAEQQINMTQEDGMPEIKVLFAMRGTDEVATVVTNMKKIKTWFPDFDIFTIVSNADVGSRINGGKVDRNEFFKKLNSTKKALIFHYDILAEGIDVQGITGVAILRHMKHAKLLQTVGRALRIYRPKPALKKQAWISISILNNDTEGYNFVKDVIQSLMAGGFGVNHENIVLTDENGKGIDENEGLGNLHPENGDALGQHWSLTDVMHKVEDDLLDPIIEKKAPNAGLNF